MLTLTPEQVRQDAEATVRTYTEKIKEADIKSAIEGVGIGMYVNGFASANMMHAKELEALNVKLQAKCEQIKAQIANIESCGFECEAGPLVLSDDWQTLKNLISE